jgi:hypothetical protein
MQLNCMYMTTNATTPEEYLAGLTRERSRALGRVRDAIKRSVPAGYEEAISYGMICWQVPLSKYPDTYNKKPLLLAGLASQKNYMSLYLMPVYSDSKLLELLESSGKPLKTGKSCINFRYVEELPLDVIGEIISRCGLADYAKKAQESRRKI